MTVIDLSSDTATRPTEAMYDAMVAAKTGDEQKRADPSVNVLCERVAEVLGKESAVFLPSGVMCNNIGILVQTRRGDEVVTHHTSHIANMEGGAPAAVAGVMVRTVDGEYGQFDAETLLRAIRRSPKKNVAQTTLVTVEQTSNRGGGSVWPREAIRDVASVARDHDVAVHMDGARLLNAAVASGLAPADFAGHCDTVWIDFSKGLGCPVGAVLAGPDDLIERAWRWKHRLGGAMRQAGVLAGACLYALDHHVDRLADDHRNAFSLAKALADIPGVQLPLGMPQTNIVFFDISRSGVGSADLADGLARQNVSIGVESAHMLRAVTHLDVSEADTATAADVIRDLLAKRA